ncbi:MULTISPECIES: GntR family transcriptional regulator [Streptomyces]|uniref:GntR family transcriptional regulator n=1 Tax=Streptomyces phaeofaciens TaxID=68254 RepID=A0A918HFB0_9ACTN|nr:MULTISPECIES: GntR family transcriptional regulator [Streptomyces]MBK3634480.1 GntR family transcriptional regulator [Streptomyces sp. MBT97]GGT60615.1 GntR family transcriptional regulator [Streptomyces phaeofaciens]
MPETARQIADDLRARIESGELVPGDRLPGEPSLVKTYGVAKMTANQALKILVSEGLAVARPGSGTYVREFRPIRRVANDRLSKSRREAGQSIWSADVAQRPLVTDVQVYEAEAPRQIGRLLNLEPGAAVIVRSRKFVVEDRPVQIATSYLPADLVRDTAIAQPNTGPGGSYARLAELGAEPVLFSEELRARMPSEEERTALALAAGTPVLEICRTAFTEDERPVEVNQMLLDAGSYVLEYRLSS